MARRPEIQLTKVAQMKGHKDAIYDFVFDKQNHTIYSAGAEGYVVKWNLDNPENGSLVLQGGEAFYSITKQGNHLQLGSRNGELFRVDLSENKLLSKVKLHKGGIFFMHNELSGGEDGFLSLKSEVFSERIKISNSSLRCILETEVSYFIGASDHLIYEIDKVDFDIKRILAGHTNSVFALELIDDTTLVSIGRDAMIRAWDLTIGEQVNAVPAHEYQAKSLSWNGRILLSSSMDKTIKLWDSELDLLKVIDFERYQGHTNCINKVQWLDENMFVSCSDDRMLYLWKVDLKP
jgi:WD40 repeat protein